MSESLILSNILTLISSSSIALSPAILSKNHTLRMLIYKYKKSQHLPASRFDNYSREINAYCNQLLSQNLIRDISGRTSRNTNGLFVKLGYRSKKFIPQTNYDTV